MRSGDETLELRAWGWEFRVKGLEFWLEFLEVTVQGYFCRVFYAKECSFWSQPETLNRGQPNH